MTCQASWIAQLIEWTIWAGLDNVGLIGRMEVTWVICWWLGLDGESGCIWLNLAGSANLSSSAAGRAVGNTGIAIQAGSRNADHGISASQAGT